MNDGLGFVLLAFAVAFLSPPLFADNPPKWMDAETRGKLFPASSYYVGFAVAETNTGEPLENILDRIKQTACGDLVASIRVMVQRVITDQLTNITDSKTIYTKDVFSSLSTLTTGKAEIPGIQVETYVDDKKHIVAAFAYVPIHGLTAKFQRQLMMQLSRIEVRQEETSQYISSGNRKQARISASSARELLSVVEDTRLTMLAIDNNLTDEELMTNEWQSAELKMVALESELKRTVKVFLNCTNADNSFVTMLCGELARSGCVLVDTASQAEWSIGIDVLTKPLNQFRRDEYTFYFVNATASLTIKYGNGDIVYTDSKNAKGGHTLGYEAATTDAFRTLAIELGKTIINIIQ